MVYSLMVESCKNELKEGKTYKEMIENENVFEIIFLRNIGKVLEIWERLKLWKVEKSGPKLDEPNLWMLIVYKSLRVKRRQ